MNDGDKLNNIEDMLQQQDHNLIIGITHKVEYEDYQINRLDQLIKPSWKDSLEVIAHSGDTHLCPIIPVSYPQCYLLPWSEDRCTPKEFIDAFDSTGKLVAVKDLETGSVYRFENDRIKEVNNSSITFPSKNEWNDYHPTIEIDNFGEVLHVTSEPDGVVQILRPRTNDLFVYTACAGGAVTYELDNTLENQFGVISHVHWEYWKSIGIGCTEEDGQNMTRRFPIFFGIALVELTISGNNRVIRCSSLFTIGRQQWEFGNLSVKNTNVPPVDVPLIPLTRDFPLYVYEFEDIEGGLSKPQFDLRTSPITFRIPLSASNSTGRTHLISHNESTIIQLKKALASRGVKTSSNSNSLIKVEDNIWADRLGRRARRIVNLEVSMLTSRLSAMEYRIANRMQPPTPLGAIIAVTIENIPSGSAPHGVHWRDSLIDDDPLSEISVANSSDINMIDNNNNDWSRSGIGRNDISNKIDPYNKTSNQAPSHSSSSSSSSSQEQRIQSQDIMRLIAASNATTEEVDDIFSSTSPKKQLRDLIGGVLGDINYSDWLPHHLRIQMGRRTESDSNMDEQHQYNDKLCKQDYWNFPSTIGEALLHTSFNEVQYFVIDFGNLGPIHPSHSATYLYRSQISQRLGVFHFLPFEQITSIAAVPLTDENNQFLFDEKDTTSVGSAPFHPETFAIGTFRDRGSSTDSRGSLYIHSLLPYWSIFIDDIEGNDAFGSYTNNDLLDDLILNSKGCICATLLHFKSPLTDVNPLGFKRPKLCIRHTMAGPIWNYEDDLLAYESDSLMIDKTPMLLFSAGEKAYLLALKSVKNTSRCNNVVNPVIIKPMYQFFHFVGAVAGPSASHGRKLIGFTERIKGTITFGKCLLEYNDALVIHKFGQSHNDLSPSNPSAVTFLSSEGNDCVYLRLVVASSNEFWTYTYPSNLSMGDLVAPRLSDLSSMEVLRVCDKLSLDSEIVQIIPWRLAGIHDTSYNKKLRFCQRLALLENGSIFCIKLIVD